jgi:hypothetical protein
MFKDNKEFLKRAYDEREGDSSKKSQGASKHKIFNYEKNAAKRAKEAETKFSSSEGGPQYLTDKGSPIPIEKSPKPTRSPERQTLEEELVQEMRKDRGKRISDYDSSYNCHGYVFTDGKAGWINTTATVEKILKENGFKRITSGSYGNRDYTYTQLPKKEDIVIYRNKYNKAVHSGVIIECSNNLDNIFVRSKIGHFGVFEHPLTNSCIQRDLLVTHWEIYHTDRPQGRFITGTSSKHKGDHQ